MGMSITPETNIASIVRMEIDRIVSVRTMANTPGIAKMWLNSGNQIDTTRQVMVCPSQNAFQISR